LILKIYTSDWCTFFFSTYNAGRSGFVGKSEYRSSKWNGENIKTLLGEGDISRPKIDKKGEYLYYLKKGGTLHKIKVATEKPKPENLAFAAKMDIDHIQERQQLFNE